MRDYSQTSKAESELEVVYNRARTAVARKIVESPELDAKRYYNSIMVELEKQMKAIKKANNYFAMHDLPMNYADGLRAVYDQFTKAGLKMDEPQPWTRVHTEAINLICSEAHYALDIALATIGRRTINQVHKSIDSILRQTGLRAAGVKIASGTTVYDMRAELEKELRNINGFMSIRYGGEGGPEVPVEVYAAMVARTTTREAGNEARFNQLQVNGYDLVQMTEHFPTCEICAQLQGRVYSISGKDKRFPPLTDALGDTYKTVHPNCRHSFVPWIEELQTPEEVEQAQRDSTRPRTDSRTAAMVEAYREQQAKGRRERENYKAYQRMQLALGMDAPKSFAAYMRIKNAGGEKWETLKALAKRYDRQEYIDKIMARLPYPYKSKIAEGLRKAPLEMAELMARTVGGVGFGTAKTGAHYRPSTCTIHMATALKPQDVAETFFHEYAHYLQDLDRSGLELAAAGPIYPTISRAAINQGYHADGLADLQELLDSAAPGKYHVAKGIPECRIISTTSWERLRAENTEPGTSREVTELQNLVFKKISRELGYRTRAEIEEQYGAPVWHDIVTDEYLKKRVEWEKTDGPDLAKKEYERLEAIYAEKASRFTTVSDILDAISLGEVGMLGLFAGHGATYYDRDPSLAPNETWANYWQLRAHRDDEMLKFLEKLAPRTKRTMDSLFEAFMKENGGGKK